MNQPWIYMCSPSRSPLPPPSPPDPSGSSQCTRPEHLSHASNLGWWSVSPLIIHMFWCCSLEIFHPRLLPQSPKVYSVHLCLFFCFAFQTICWRQRDLVLFPFISQTDISVKYNTNIFLENGIKTFRVQTNFFFSYVIKSSNSIKMLEGF